MDTDLTATDESHQADSDLRREIEELRKANDSLTAENQQLKETNAHLREQLEGGASYSQLAKSVSTYRNYLAEAMMRSHKQTDKQFSVLLVEDDIDFIDLIGATLHRSVLKPIVKVAQTVDEALDLVESQPFDIAIVDVSLPGGSGFDLLAAWKESDELRRMPVIMLSERSEQEDIERAYDLGAASYLEKYVSKTAMETLIDSILTFWLGQVKLPG